MKRILSIVLATAILATLCLTLASCGKLSGKYSADIWGTGTTLEFKGNKVTIAITVLGKEVASTEATYSIKKGEISFDIADEDKIENTLAKKVIAALEEPSAFEKGDDYIKIGGTKYTKVDK